MEEYDPKRVYLSASNRVNLALKVFGYSVLGYLILALIFITVFALFGFLANLGR
ncbi:MAG: hypothetical protein ACRDGJ_10125 [Candidatus Limnocylindria bacterium]